jgi:aryl-alcohol dehydrogenase-like predicted oxidoreductase
MRLRQLGKTKIKITPIGLGCWQFSGGRSMIGNYWAAIQKETINQIVKTSLENGINWFDTAEAYGFGQSEISLAAALKSGGIQPEKAIIATKWFPVGRFASSILKTVDTRLKKLYPYPISLFQIHQPISFSSVENQLKAMAVLLRVEKIMAVGISNFDRMKMQRAYDALKAEGFVLASNQMRYSLLDRSIEKNGVLDFAKANGITIIAYSPLAQGILTGKFHDNPELVRSLSGFRKYLPGFRRRNIQKSQPLIDELKIIAATYKVTPAQVALNWVINFHGDTVVAIPGASSVKQAQQNAAVMKFALSKGELARLDQISQEVINLY